MYSCIQTDIVWVQKFEVLLINLFLKKLFRIVLCKCKYIYVHMYTFL